MQCSSRDAVPARTGGDEFVLIQSYQSDEVSRELVLRIRRTLEAEGKSPEASVPVVHEYRNCRDGSGIRTVFCRLCKNCRQPDVRGKGTEAGRKKIEKYIYNR